MGRDLDGTGGTRVFHVADTAFAVDPSQIIQVQYVRPASPKKGISHQFLFYGTQILRNDLRMTPGQMQVGVRAIGLAIYDVFRIDQQVSRSRVQFDPGGSSLLQSPQQPLKVMLMQLLFTGSKALDGTA